jgi:hypothetical protein
MQKPSPPVLQNGNNGRPAHIAKVLDGHAPAAHSVGLRLIAKAMREGAEYIRQLEEYVAHLEKERAGVLRLPTGDYTA